MPNDAVPHNTEKFVTHEEYCRVALDGLLGNQDPFETAFRLSRPLTEDQNSYAAELPPSNADDPLFSELLPRNEYLEMHSAICYIHSIDLEMLRMAHDQLRADLPTKRCFPRLQVELLFDRNSGTTISVRVLVLQSIDSSNGIPGDFDDNLQYQTEIPFNEVSAPTKEELEFLLYEQFIAEIGIHSFMQRLEG